MTRAHSLLPLTGNGAYYSTAVSQKSMQYPNFHRNAPVARLWGAAQQNPGGRKTARPGWKLLCIQLFRHPGCPAGPFAPGTRTATRMAPSTARAASVPTTSRSGRHLPQADRIHGIAIGRSVHRADRPRQAVLRHTGDLCTARFLSNCAWSAQRPVWYLKQNGFLSRR